MQEPDWLTKARAEGRISETRLDPAAVLLGWAMSPANLPFDERFANEAEFQKAVIELAHQYKAKVAHFRKVCVADANGGTHWETPAAADGKGWPDLFIAIEGCRPIVPELKVGKNAPTPEQWEWIKRLRSCGLHVPVWYPSDWAEIVETFSRPVHVEQEAIDRMIGEGCPNCD